MSGIDSLQREVRAVLTDACFVRRDQTARALFVSDYPARHRDGKKEELESLGFRITEEGKLWRIDLAEDRARQFENGLPLLPLPEVRRENAEAVTLCRMMLTHGGFQWDDTRRTLLALASGGEKRLYQELNGICAARLRKHEPLSEGAAKLILMHLKEEEKC